jgi:peptide/nickel transport system ATP-binding protein
MPAANDRPLALQVRDLGVRLTSGARPLLEGVSFDLARGASLGVVGPSGAGKTTLALALMGLLPRHAAVTPGATLRLGTTPLHDASPETRRLVRGRRMAMVFQEPMLALHPALSVQEQVAEVGTVHGLPPETALRRALDQLARVGLVPAATFGARRPHELSGGQRQRVLLAMAMFLEPEVLIADEPTTALDPALQREVLDQIDALRRNAGTALILISHDPDVIRERCDTVLQLRDGRPIAPEGPGAGGARPSPITRPSVGGAATTTTPGPSAAEPAAPVLLDVRDLVVRYTGPSASGDAATAAVDGVSFTLARGETLGLIGPSGAGKSTLTHALVRLLPVAGGSIHFDGTDLSAIRGEPLRRLRRRLQLVAQDAGASLTPHLTAETLVAEGLEVHGLARGSDARRRARTLLDEVGLPARAAAARPRELSSGERQRVALARALAPAPDLLVCDEPWAALDPDRRDAILALLDDLRARHGLALLVISHDHDAVHRLASRVLPMYLGRVAAAAHADAT